jgi:hypothetical protein
MHTPKDPDPGQTEPNRRTKNASLHKRAPDTSLPTRIRLVRADVDSRGRLTVTVDGEQFTPAPIGREAFGSLLDEVLRARGTALRVEVHEADGSNYVDLLTTPDRIEPEPKEPPIAVTDSAARSPLLEISGGGFVPGEDVAFAPILIHSSARSDGSVRSLVEFNDRVGEVLVFGRVSGTIHVAKVPQ